MDNSTIRAPVITWAFDKKPAFNCLQYKINETSGNRSISWSYKNCSSKLVAACRVILLFCYEMQYVNILNILKRAKIYKQLRQSVSLEKEM
jgi:hypothetical protein